MWLRPFFRDRTEAGRILADRLGRIAADRNLLVLALPRGGVPVGYEVAQARHADLDVFLVRKLGVPGHEELALGAIASGGVRVLNPDVIRQLAIPAALIDRITDQQEREIRRREALYRDGRPGRSPAGRTVILVDDGLATGASMRAAVRAVRSQRPARMIVAVPVASREICDEFAAYADDVVCAETPEPFQAVGLWYEDFTQTSDDEVRELLKRAAAMPVA